MRYRCPTCGQVLRLPDPPSVAEVAKQLGSRGGAANTPAQQAHRATIFGKGRPKGAKNRPKVTLDGRGPGG